MSSAPLARFSATAVAESPDWTGSQTATVVLRHGELAFEAGDERLSIPLESIFDINTGSVPPLFDSLPGMGVTIAYDSGDERVVAAIGADESLVRKFTTATFKTILNNTLVRVKHPATRGGRVTGAAFESALLSISTSAVTFDTDDSTVGIDIDGVVGFTRNQQAADGQERPAIEVRHFADGTAITTQALTDSPRTLSLLGRYLRRQYDERLASLQQLSLSEAEIKTLVTIYSTRGTGVAARDVLDFPPDTVRKLLHSLQTDSLVRRGSGGPELTTTGQIVVTQYLEQVNE
ncbi:MAG: CheF family chemotaxis protein [Halovenus sp.]